MDQKLTSVLLVAAVVVGLGCSKPSESAIPSATSNPAVVVPELVTIGSLDIVIDATMEVGGALATTTLRGPVGHQSLSATPDSRWEMWSFKDVTIAAAAANEPQKQLEPLTAPVFVERDANSQPLNIAFAPGIPAKLRQIAEFAVANLVLTAPVAEPDKPHRERDSLGWFTVQTSQDEHGLIGRRKLKYEPKPGELTWTVESSDWSARFDAHGRLASLTSAEVLAGTAKPLGVKLKNYVTATVGSGLSVAAFRGMAPPREYQSYEFGRAGSASAAEDDKVIAGNLTLDDVIRTINDKNKSGAGWAANYRAAAFLRLHGDAVDSLVRRATEAPDTFSNTLSVLVEAGSPKAQAAIADWLRNCDPTRCATILAQVGKKLYSPTAELVDVVLLQLAGTKENRVELWTAVAGMLGRASKLKTPEATEWVRKAVEVWRGIGDPHEQAVAMGALSTIRNGAFEELALTQADHQNVEIALRAIDGLGTQATDASNRKLLEIATSKRSNRERARAYSVMSGATLELHVRQLLVSSRTEGDEVVLAEIVRSLARIATNNPEARSRLKAMMSTSSSTRVALEARDALAQLNVAERSKKEHGK